MILFSEENKIKDVLKKAIIILDTCGEIKIPTDDFDNFISFSLIPSKINRVHIPTILIYSIKTPTDLTSRKIIHEKVQQVAKKYRLNLVTELEKE